MKVLCIILATMLVIVTFGILDVEISFTDGTRFIHKSWLHLFNRK